MSEKIHRDDAIMSDCGYLFASFADMPF